VCCFKALERKNNWINLERSRIEEYMSKLNNITEDIIGEVGP